MTSLKKIILVALALPISLQVSAQSFDSKVVTKAMQEELERNVSTLMLPGSTQPFFMDYAFVGGESVAIKAANGAILTTSVKPRYNNFASVGLKLGDYYRTSDVRYGIPDNASAVPMNADADAVKRALWNISDEAYKAAVNMNSQKQNFLMQNPRTGEMADLADFEEISVSELKSDVSAPLASVNLDIAQWENNLRKLSAIFNNYKEINNSEVVITMEAKNIIRVTSEGVARNESVTVVNLIYSAAVFTPEGQSMADNVVITKLTLDELPSMEKLEENINKFAKNLIEYASAEYMGLRYSGPVLFMNGSAAGILNNQIIGSLSAVRPQEGGQLGGAAFGKRLNEQIIDKRITIKNYTTMKEYNGTKLYGSYDVDAEGVVPAAEMLLIENGAIKMLMNGRIPAEGAANSTGSNRFTVYGPMSQYGVLSVAPGTIHYQISKGTKEASMKKALLKLAKKEKSEFAYIVKGLSAYAPKIYRVNVKTGEETLIRGARIGAVQLSKLKELAAISAEEEVVNTLSPNGTLFSFIAPKSIIVNDVEIVKSGDPKTKVTHLTAPLRRK